MFIDVQRPLKYLINYLNIARSTNDKCTAVSNLDKLIEEFDYHNDCIQHLCLFALGFSDDTNCKYVIYSAYFSFMGDKEILRFF